MTQSQLKFAGATSILAWAGKNSVLQYIRNRTNPSLDMPYIIKDDLYYYFGVYPGRGYELVMTSSRDLNGE